MAFRIGIGIKSSQVKEPLDRTISIPWLTGMTSFTEDTGDAMYAEKTYIWKTRLQNSPVCSGRDPDFRSTCRVISIGKRKDTDPLCWNTESGVR